MKNSYVKQAADYLNSFLSYGKGKIWVALFMTVFIGLTEGVGLLLLIPLLSFLGLNSGGSGNHLLSLIQTIFSYAGIPLTLFSLLCLYILILGLHSILRRYWEVWNTRLVYGYTRFLQDRLYGELSGIQWLPFLKMSSADILRVLTSDLWRVSYATRELLSLISTTILIGIYIGVSFYNSFALTLFTLLATSLLFLILKSLTQKARHSGETLQGSIKDMYSAVLEHLGGMKLAKSYGLEQAHSKRFFSITERIENEQILFTKVNSETRMYQQIGAAMILVLFIYISNYIFKISPTHLFLTIFIFSRLLPKATSLQQTFQHILNSLPAFEATNSMQQFLAKNREPLSPHTTRKIQIEESIQFKNVSFSYDSSSPNTYQLKNIDLVIPAQQTIAITGPSGSGKTTLADILLGLLLPTEGSVLIDRKPLTGEIIHDWRSSVGYVPQDTFLFNDTVRANLLWAKPPAEEPELWEALHLASANSFVANLPQGLDTILGDRGIRLSGGERQRIALARALLRKPTLLVLDEATSSLDMENELKIQEAIEHLQGKLTLFIIAHRLSTIQNADGIVILENGTIRDNNKNKEMKYA